MYGILIRLLVLFVLLVVFSCWQLWKELGQPRVLVVDDQVEEEEEHVGSDSRSGSR